MADDRWVDAGSGEVWLGRRGDDGLPVPVARSAVEKLLIDLELLRPPPGATDEHRTDWFRTRAILLDLVRRGAAGTEPAAARLAAGLVDETLSEAGLMFAEEGAAPVRGRHRSRPHHSAEAGVVQRVEPPPEPLWRRDMEALIKRYRREFPEVHPRHVVPAPPVRSGDPHRYRAYFRLTDPATGSGPGTSAPSADRAIWHAHRAEHLEAVAAQLFHDGLCGSELARKAAAGARASAFRAATGT
jgi:hypothetical protein